jgi:hypothetical protein
MPSSIVVYNLKLTAVISHGCNPQCCTRYATLAVRTRVFPDPGPARICNGISRGKVTADIHASLANQSRLPTVRRAHLFAGHRSASPSKRAGSRCLLKAWMMDLLRHCSPLRRTCSRQTATCGSTIRVEQLTVNNRRGDDWHHVRN